MSPYAYVVAKTKDPGIRLFDPYCEWDRIYGLHSGQ